MARRQHCLLPAASAAAATGRPVRCHSQWHLAVHYGMLPLFDFLYLALHRSAAHALAAPARATARWHAAARCPAAAAAALHEPPRDPRLHRARSSLLSSFTLPSRAENWRSATPRPDSRVACAAFRSQPGKAGLHEVGAEPLRLALHSPRPSSISCRYCTPPLLSPPPPTICGACPALLRSRFTATFLGPL